MIKHKNVLAIIITFCNSTSNNVNLFFSQQAIFEISPFTPQKSYFVGAPLRSKWHC